VFNHCGRGFFAFADILENGENSPYIDWFHLKRIPVDAFSEGQAEDYLAWWSIKSLPKFNTQNPSVRKYLIDVARYWVLQGADGWRLDVPSEIDDDSFWAEFRNAVKTINQDAYLVGEIWTADARWVGSTHFDGLMNYPVRDCLLRVLHAGTLDTDQCAERMDKLLQLYPRENAYAMYVPLGSHDTERIWTKLGGDIRKVKLAYLFLFAYPGAPAIYYGDEIGLAGGTDPECRASFPWDSGAWNNELRDWVKSLVYIRKRNPALRRGDYVNLLPDSNKRCYAFARVQGDRKTVMAMNASALRRQLRLSAKDIGWEDGRIVRDLLGREEYIVSGDRLLFNLPPWSGVLLD
jgi:glycosidase